MRKVQEFAVYRGDEFLVVGTAEECNKFMGWKNPRQVYTMATPSRRKRTKKPDEGIIAIRLEND